MGILTRLFGGTPAPAASKSTKPATVLGPVPRLRDTARHQTPDGPVDWPVDAATGVVFDDEWLLAGLKTAVNENQFRSALEDQARRRRERLYTPGLDGHDQLSDMLRGRDWLEWGDHVRQMKREGYLESALTLVYEIIDTADRSNSPLWDKVPPGWFNEAAVIHRKLKDYDGEVRILQRALESYPGSTDYQSRMEKAQALLSKA
jgi:tetratricopeptide (TPR) repeat protein